MPDHRSTSFLRLWLNADERASMAERALLAATAQSKDGHQPAPLQEQREKARALRAEATRLFQLATQQAESGREEAAAVRREAALVRQQVARALQGMDVPLPVTNAANVRARPIPGPLPPDGAS